MDGFHAAGETVYFYDSCIPLLSKYAHIELGSQPQSLNTRVIEVSLECSRFGTKRVPSSHRGMMDSQAL